jgi:hypothetical protein
MVKERKGKPPYMLGLQGDTSQDPRMSVPQIFGLPTSTIGSRKHHFCLRARCSVGLRDFDTCGEVSCQGCENVIRCTNCHESFCVTCRKVIRAMNAQKSFALNASTNVEEACDNCDKTLCKPCDVDGQNILIKSCDACGAC